MPSKTKVAAILLTITVSLTLHFRIFKLDLMGQHVWRQTQTQLNILHFAKDDANILHPKTNYLDTPDGIHRMEFPLMQWTIGMLDRIFGYSIFLTRLLMFLAGILAALGMGRLSKEVFRSESAFIPALWLITFSPLFYYYTMNPIPDVWALAFSIWGMAMFFDWINKGALRSLYLSGVFLSLGALIKLPFILYFVLFAVRAVQERRGGFFRSVSKMTGGWIWILLPLSWYITVIPTWENNPVVAGILHNDSQSAAGLWSILLGNLVSVLPEILVNYAALPLFLYGFWIMRERHVRTDARYMLLLSVSFSVAAYFFFEMHLIATNHDYYLFPFLPLIMLISTAGALSLLSTKTGRIFLTVCMLILPVTAFRRMDSRWDMERPGFNKDLIEFADRIRNIIPENDRIFCAGDPSGNIWFYYLDRKGWNSMYNADMQFIRDKKGLGAKWIVTDRRSYLDSLANDPMLRIDTASISQFNSFCVAPMK